MFSEFSPLAYFKGEGGHVFTDTFLKCLIYFLALETDATFMSDVLPAAQSLGHLSHSVAQVITLGVSEHTEALHILQGY